MKGRILRRALWASAAAALLLFPPISMSQASAHGCSHHSRHSKCAECTACARAVRCNGWCRHCGVGYVDGRKFHCKSCHRIRCSDDGGWCDSCETGYARGRETKCRSCLIAIQNDVACKSCDCYYAKGRRTTCRSCHALMLSQKGGWCSRCDLGHAKGVVTHCRSCCRAIRTDSSCRGCGLWYVDGQATRCPDCHALQKAHGCDSHCRRCAGRCHHHGRHGCGH